MPSTELSETVDLQRPVITDENRERIARVLADPVNAWRSEPTRRKIAHLRQRGVRVPDDATVAEVDAKLERVIGEDDLVLTTWLGQGTRAGDAVALIRQPAPATGFLVSDWLLLTNHHVLDTPDVAAGCDVLFRYEEDVNGAIDPVKVACDPDRCFITSAVDDLDYTLVAVHALPDGTAPGQRFGRVPLIGAVGKAVVGQPVNIIQHPGGQSRRVAFRDNKLLSVDDERQLVYETDTKPGSSGSPVFNDRWQLVALHHASEPARDANGVEIDVNGRPVTSSTPEYLRQWVANAGIRVSRLVADLHGRDLAPDVRALVDSALL
jgi:V8-like Glu-specific endopeptidase